MARTVILGDGGHGRAVQSVFGGEILSPDAEVPETAIVFIGIGDNARRKELFERYERQIPYAGVQRMTGAIVVRDNGRIGRNVLLNTGCQVDHDCTIGDHCSLAPGAVLCGGVTLGEGCAIGAGAVVLQGVTLPPWTKVPAGSLVVSADDIRRPARA